MKKEKYTQYSFMLDRTARRVKQYAQTSFSERAFDMTIDQWSILKVLNNEETLTHKDLAEKTGKDQPTITRIIDILIKKELVARVDHPADRRCLLVELTTKGKKKVQKLSPEIAQIRMKAWENLSDEDFKNFTRILNTIYNNLS